jgi:RimJ/RimL family protein N-acetyltransferase
MKFYKYGIILERLKEEDIELVRHWRNSDPVRLNMNYREIINPEQQLEWFHSINNQQFHYVIIHYKGEKIGLLNDKNIDWDTLTSETGIFIGRPELFNTSVSYLVSVAGIETMFNFLGWNKQYAHILRSNTNAVGYNLQLGYKLCKGQENADHQLYELTRDSFEQMAGKIRKAVRSLAGEDNKVSALLEPGDYESGIAQRFEDLLKRSPYPVERKETGEGIWYREMDRKETKQD